MVRGVVQGVNFRATAADEARQLGLTGRVWNRADGAVECVAEGDGPALDRFRDWLARGPRFARVQTVDVAVLDGDVRYEDFRISGSAAE